MKISNDLTQKRWLKICKNLGLQIDKKGGKGSHCKVVCPGKAGLTTVPCKMNPGISRSIYKRLLEWGFTDAEITEAMKKS